MGAICKIATGQDVARDICRLVCLEVEKGRGWWRRVLVKVKLEATRERKGERKFEQEAGRNEAARGSQKGKRKSGR